MDQALRDELEIRQMVERWAVWRDAGDWEEVAANGSVVAGEVGDQVFQIPDGLLRT